MKKILAILMALTMVLSLAACAAPAATTEEPAAAEEPAAEEPAARSLLRRPSLSNWLASSPPATMVSPVRALPTARWKPKPSWRSTKALRSW